MNGPEDMGPDNLADVAATDALLDDLAAGRPVEVRQLDDDDEAAMAGLLATWRAELDDRAGTVMTAPPLVVPATRPSRWVRAHQRTAAATAVVVALAASGGVAAAASGPTGPLGGLHKLIFGHPAVHQVDTFAAAARGLLEKADHQINAASQAGSITAHARDHIAGELDKAAGFLASDSHAPQSLLDRVASLRTALDGIPLATPAPVVTDHHGGQSGSDDNQGSDRHGGGSDNQGDDRTSGGDDNHQSGSQDDSSQGGQSGDDGSQDGASSGSDDGSGGGGDQSGSGDGSSGGDQSSDDGGGGGSSDGGDSSSGGSQDDTAQSSISQSTISDDGSAEGDGHSGGE